MTVLPIPTTAVGATTFDLVTLLIQAGASIRSGDHYLKLRASTERPPKTPSLAGILDLTPEQLDADAVAAGVQRFAATAIEERKRQQRNDLDAAIREELIRDADRYLDQLRPTFDAAANRARAVRERGLAPDANDMSIGTMHGTEAAEAWQAFTPVDVFTLDRIGTIRALMAEVLGLAEGPSGDHTAGVTHPFNPDFAPRWQTRRVPERQYWLTVASRAQLVPVHVKAAA